MDEMDVVARLIDAIQDGDVDEVRRCFHPDAVIWHNFDQKEQTVDETVAVLAWMVKKLPGRRYEDVVRHRIPGGVVEQHVIRGTTAAGIAVEIPASLFVTVEDGLVTRVEEYLDPAQAAPLSA